MDSESISQLATGAALNGQVLIFSQWSSLEWGKLALYQSIQVSRVGVLWVQLKDTALMPLSASILSRMMVLYWILTILGLAKGPLTEY